MPLVKAGDRVELRPPAEILASLDDEARLEGVPFMPEMLQYFGSAYTVSARVERACDTICNTGARRLPGTVMLEDLRCDGSGHAGCQAECRIYWKEAWLQAAARQAGEDVTKDPVYEELRRRVEAGAVASESTPEARVFRCQATELVRASDPVGWWSARSIVNELTSGNVGVRRFISVVTRIVVEELGRRLRVFSSDPFRSHEKGGSKTPGPAPYEFRPGELVQIRSKAEVGPTLSPEGKNRGLWFDREMLAFCGKTARVRTKVERFVDERTGRFIELSSDCYLLDGVVCDSARSEGRWFCPRAIYPWWRAAWLKPLEVSDRDEQARPAVD